MAAITPILITNPWAHGTTDTDNVVIPIDVTSGTIANQVDGFPPLQEEDPLVGGEYVKRAEMNGVFKLYSLLLNFINQGGQFTFNPSVASSGGYDAGVILYCAPDNTFQRSLINGNVANFLTTPIFRNDGINWSTAFKCGDFNATAITSVGDIVSTNGVLYSYKSGVEVVTPRDQNIAFRATKISSDHVVELLVDALPGINMTNVADTSYVRIGLIPGQRTTTGWSGQEDSGIVIHSDFRSFTQSHGNANWNWVKLPKDENQPFGMVIMFGTIPGDIESTLVIATPIPVNSIVVSATPPLGDFTIITVGNSVNQFLIQANGPCRNSQFTLIGLTS